jgi:hypothetical protein
MPKPEMNTPRKENYRPLSLMNTNSKMPHKILVN